MIRLGICADPGHPEINAQAVLDSGAQIVSFVLKQEDTDVRAAFAEELHSAGVRVLGLLVYGESTQNHESARDDARFYREAFGESIDFLSVGNEPDLEATWQDPLDYLEFLYETLAGWGPRGETEVWGPGLGSGDPAWMDPIKDDLLRLVDRVPVHPYGQGADDEHPGPFGLVENLIEAYRQYIKTARTRPSPSVMADEWGISASDAADDHERAEYITAMIIKFRELGVDSCLFGLGPMVPDYDIRGSGGEPTEMYAAFVGSFA